MRWWERSIGGAMRGGSSPSSGVASERSTSGGRARRHGQRRLPSRICSSAKGSPRRRVRREQAVGKPATLPYELRANATLSAARAGADRSWHRPRAMPRATSRLYRDAGAGSPKPEKMEPGLREARATPPRCSDRAELTRPESTMGSCSGTRGPQPTPSARPSVCQAIRELCRARNRRLRSPVLYSRRRNAELPTGDSPVGVASNPITGRPPSLPRNEAVRRNFLFTPDSAIRVERAPLTIVLYLE
jgi:hypothetical protein